MRRTVAFCICIGVSLSIAAGCSRDPRAVADRQFATRIKSTFGMSVPCSLAWCGGYLDGSTGGVLVGTARHTLLWSWGLPPSAASVRRDGTHSNSWVDSVVRATPIPVYIGAAHYRAAGAKPLAVGSSSESLFIQLLWMAVAADSVFIPPPGEHDKRPMAASIARAPQRQRAGLPALRLFSEMSTPVAP